MNISTIADSLRKLGPLIRGSSGAPQNGPANPISGPSRLCVIIDILCGFNGKAGLINRQMKAN